MTGRSRVAQVVQLVAAQSASAQPAPGSLEDDARLRTQHPTAEDEVDRRAETGRAAARVDDRDVRRPVHLATGEFGVVPVDRMRPVVGDAAKDLVRVRLGADLAPALGVVDERRITKRGPRSKGEFERLDEASARQLDVAILDARCSFNGVRS